MELLLIFKDGIASYFRDQLFQRPAISETSYFRAKNQTIPNSNLIVKFFEINNYTPDTFSNIYLLKRDQKDPKKTPRNSLSFILYIS
jgi:hypothetical protein